MYSTYNESKSVVPEWVIRTLKNKIFQHMAAVSKNVYFDVLDNIVNKYNNKVHWSIKVKPVDVTSDSYAKYNKDSNEKNPKFKVGENPKFMLGFQNTKTFLLKDTLKIGQNKFLLSVKLKTPFRGHTWLVT